MKRSLPIAAVQALGKIDPKNPDVTAALLRALSDKRKGVQKAAAVALASSQ
ncbi:MAG: sister chromatid cohesion protein PDS5 [Planctomycetes bacterium]|nr:sister chromatid cohesion protein PDS5 [Planctomycetota bacterium]